MSAIGLEPAEQCCDATVEIDWAGSLGFDTAILQFLLALSREEQTRLAGAAAAATSNPE